MAERNIAIVYDWMDSWGGVERLLLTLNEMYPEAEWFTSYVDYKRASWINKLQIPNNKLQTNSKIKVSFIQSLPSFIKKNRILSLPLYPYAFEGFNFTGYDLVISVTSSFAKSVITHPGTKHICILLTPTRWLWSHHRNYKLEIINNKLLNPIVAWYINRLRDWDYVVAKRPDKIVSISQTVADRCLKYYGCESDVVYPPFNFEYWDTIKSEIRSSKSETNPKFKNTGILKHSNLAGPSDVACRQVQDDIGKYYLVVSRLEPYKKVDLVIETFNQMRDKKLIIVGKGTQEHKLKAIAGDNIQFIHDIFDQELASLYSHAKALIMPQEEDFGYVALEALFFGCLVIAYDRGGATETVIAGKTGIFFEKQTRESLRNAVAEFERRKYNLGGRQAILDTFSKEKFIRRIRKLCA